MPVREMTEADLPQVLAIQQQLGFQEWNEREFIAEIRASYALCVVFEQTNSIVGYAIFHLMGPDSELLSIATCESEQGKGIGSALLNAGFERLDFANGDIAAGEFMLGATNSMSITVSPLTRNAKNTILTERMPSFTRRHSQGAQRV